METKWEFDERQLQIRGQVFFHGFITALTLLLINAILQDRGIIWANGFHQNILIMILASTVTSVEAILRSAFFGKGKSRWMVIGVFGLLSLVLWVLNVQHIIQGSTVVENNMLTQIGFSLVLAALFTIMTIAGVLKETLDKYQERKS
jgi:hypothetical protein